MRRLRYLLPLLLLAYLLTGVAQVGYDERAVVRRFGRVIDRTGPGLRIGLPWGGDQVDKFKVRTVQLTVGYNPDETAEHIAGRVTRWDPKENPRHQRIQAKLTVKMQATSEGAVATRVNCRELTVVGW